MGGGGQKVRAARVTKLQTLDLAGSPARREKWKEEPGFLEGCWTRALGKDAGVWDQLCLGGERVWVLGSWPGNAPWCQGPA